MKMIKSNLKHFNKPKPYLLQISPNHVCSFRQTGCKYNGRFEKILNSRVYAYMGELQGASFHYVKQNGSGDNSYTDGETFQKEDFVGLAYVLIL